METKKRLHAFVFGTLFCLSFFCASFVDAATIYSNSSTGNDTTGDGSVGSPYKTFHKAYTVAASSGDTVDLTGTFTWTDADETGDASGTGYTLSKSMTIQGQTAATTIIQASSTAYTADRGVFTVASGKTVVIKNLTIRYRVSTATETAGGITNSGTLTIQNSIITYNKYDSMANYYGAGGIMMKHDANGVLTIATSTLSNNYFNGKYYGSGGIYAGQANTITITASTFSGNTASSSNPTTFAYSYAEPSGAFGVFRSVTTVVTNSTFSGNSTNSYGGALQIYNPNSYKITNSTIANNTASAGAGGILFESSGGALVVKNTILANNTGNSTANDFYSVSGTITDSGYNIVEYSTNKTWNGTGDITGDQASLNLASSLDDNSATNGVQTLALSASSVAIDAGNSATHSSVAVPTFDQRGGTRNGTTDIGSFEYGAGGVADTTAPSVSLTAPSASATVGGASVTLSASASDNVAISGVKFYVDGTLQGSEDTTSTYGITWDSTATTSGSHSAFAVARDSSSNYATSSTVSFTVDNTAPTISAIATSTATTTATITWTTDEESSSLVYFGVTNSYGTSTAEMDTGTRVTSHSVTLAGLTACTYYNYKLQSKDATLNTGTSTNATFRTRGCTGSASVSSTGVGSITTAAGGTLTEGKVTLTVPTSFTTATSSAVFQANLLDGTAFFSSAGAPSGKTRAGDTVYNLKALTDATTTLSSFSSALTVSMTYTDDDIEGIDESTLKIYRYDSSEWNALSSCSTDTGAKTVTCSTTEFSDFAIFGDESSSDSSSSSSSSGSSVTSRVQNLREMGNHALADALVREYPDAFKNIAVVSPTVALTTESSDHNLSFTRDLEFRSEGLDVKALQEFLISKNVGRAARELSRVGASGYFGRYTHSALVEYQKSTNIRPASGYFGPRTKKYIESRE